MGFVRCRRTETLETSKSATGRHLLATAVAKWGICGGMSTTCNGKPYCKDEVWQGFYCSAAEQGFACRRLNSNYYQCRTTPFAGVAPVNQCPNPVADWQKCGGTATSDAQFPGSCCRSGDYSCQRLNSRYWQCRPRGSSNPAPTFKPVSVNNPKPTLTPKVTPKPVSTGTAAPTPKSTTPQPIPQGGGSGGGPYTFQPTPQPFPGSNGDASGGYTGTLPKYYTAQTKPQFDAAQQSYTPPKWRIGRGTFYGNAQDQCKVPVGVLCDLPIAACRLLVLQTVNDVYTE